MLLPSKSHALAVLLDLCKAYDTIDHGFLLSTMDAMGVGPEYCAWFSLLLTNTRASVVVD